MRPSQTSPPSSTPQDDHRFDLLIGDALERTFDVDEPWCAGLPVPVRYRATGALRAWEAVFHGAPGQEGAALVRELRDTAQPPVRLPQLLVEFVARLSTVDLSGSNGERLVQRCGESAYWQAFWQQSGALYEPTPTLHRMLEATDVADNIPLRMIEPPLPAVCIVPAGPSSRAGGFDAVAVFSHGVPQVSQDRRRGVTFVVQSGRLVEVQCLVIDDGSDETVSQAVNKSIEQLRATRAFTEERLQGIASRVQHALDYALKVLLYLSVEDAECVQERLFSNAPRSFPGLGKRKRELKLAEIERLYDRYLIGPTVLADATESASGAGSSEHGVSAHWRRGHFRLQPHGPQSSLRKVMFIKPTVIRPDRLGA